MLFLYLSGSFCASLHKLCPTCCSEFLLGAFCMAWPVGIAVLIGLIVTGIAAGVSSVMEKPKPNMKASKLG